MYLRSWQHQTAWVIKMKSTHLRKAKSDQCFKHWASLVPFMTHDIAGLCTWMSENVSVQYIRCSGQWAAAFAACCRPSQLCNCFASSCLQGSLSASAFSFARESAFIHDRIRICSRTRLFTTINGIDMMYRAYLTLSSSSSSFPPWAWTTVKPTL